MSEAIRSVGADGVMTFNRPADDSESPVWLCTIVGPSGVVIQESWLPATIIDGVCVVQVKVFNKAIEAGSCKYKFECEIEILRQKSLAWNDSASPVQRTPEENGICGLRRYILDDSFRSDIDRLFFS